jgi:hypothetical protein
MKPNKKQVRPNPEKWVGSDPTHVIMKPNTCLKCLSRPITSPRPCVSPAHPHPLVHARSLRPESSRTHCMGVTSQQIQRSPNPYRGEKETHQLVVPSIGDGDIASITDGSRCIVPSVSDDDDVANDSRCIRSSPPHIPWPLLDIFFSTVCLEHRCIVIDAAHPRHRQGTPIACVEYLPPPLRLEVPTPSWCLIFATT